MIVKYNILGYLIGEGFSNVFKNKKSTGASLVIMCATMIIFGVFLILGENINHIVRNEGVSNPDTGQLTNNLVIKKAIADTKGQEYSDVEKINES